MPFLQEAQNVNINGATMIDNSISQTINNDFRDVGLSVKQLLHREIAHGALHNSQERLDPPKCHPETRVQVLKDIMEWIANPDRLSNVFWLNGPAGAGKSAIAQTTAEKCVEQDLLAAAFFFSHSAATRNNPSRFIATIVYQLLFAYPSLTEIIAQVIGDDPAILNKALDYQAKKLIVEPFISGNPLPLVTGRILSKVVIIDGLDECQNEHGEQHRILELVAMLSRGRDIPLCFFISCRPESHISEQFTFTDLANISRTLPLHNVKSTQEDIRTYLKSGFATIYNRPAHRFVMMTVPAHWPTNNVIASLVYRCSGQFVYASTVLRFVDDPNLSPVQQLEIVLNAGFSSEKKENTFPALDGLYSAILSRAPDIKRTLEVLGYLILFQSLLDHHGNSLHAPHMLIMEKCLQLPLHEGYSALRALHSLVSVPEPRSELYYNREKGFKVYHYSFKEFLLDPDRSGQYYIDLRKVGTKTILSMTHTLSTFNFKDRNSDYVSLILSLQYLHRVIGYCPPLYTKELYNDLVGFDISSKWLDILDLHQIDIDPTRIHIALSECNPHAFEMLKAESKEDEYHNMWYPLACQAISLAAYALDLGGGMSQYWEANKKFLCGQYDELNYTEKFEAALDRLFHRKLEPFLRVPLSREDKLCLGLIAVAHVRRTAEVQNTILNSCRASQFISYLLPFTSNNYKNYFCAVPTAIPFLLFLFDQRRAGPFYLTGDIRASIAEILLRNLDNSGAIDLRHWQHVLWSMFIEYSTPTSELLLERQKATDSGKITAIETSDASRVIQWLKSPSLKENSVAAELLKKWTSRLPHHKDYLYPFFDLLDLN